MARKHQERKHNGENHGQPAPRVRSHCNGEYGRNPIAPRPINVSSTHILDNIATKTLLAILRAYWPEGVFSFYEAPSNFWPTVLSEFRRYYCYYPGVSNAEGDAVVKQHVVRTMTQALYEDRSRAETRANREGTSLLEQCPTYYSMGVWSSFCKHWRKRSFQTKSTINKENREKLRVVHTTGAKSFNKFKEDLTRKNNEPPTPLEFWEESHKKKGTHEWASEEARLIGEQMRRILASQESTPDWDSGISALLEAQGPIKKNRILGLPRVRANSIVPPGTHNTPGSDGGPSRSEPKANSTALGSQQPRGVLKIQSKSSNNTSSGLSRSEPRANSTALGRQQTRGVLKIRLKRRHDTSSGSSRSEPRVNSTVLGRQQPRGVLKIQSESRNNTSSSGAGPSRSGPGIPDEILVELVQRTLKAFRSDPSFDGYNHPTPEQLHILAQEVIGGSGFSSSPWIYEVMQAEMVRLMARIFEDVFKDMLKRL